MCLPHGANTLFFAYARIWYCCLFLALLCCCETLANGSNIRFVISAISPPAQHAEHLHNHKMT